MKRVILLLATITLSVGIAYAEGVVERHNFHEMYNNGSMTVNTSTKIAAIGSFTYTYSGSTARFYNAGSDTNNRICLQLGSSDAKVITSSIKALDSIAIYYCYVDTRLRVRVYTSVDNGSNWTQQTVVQEGNGFSTVKLPAVGDYMLKIERWDNIYLEGIDYTTTPPCNCLRVQIE